MDSNTTANYLIHTKLHNHLIHAFHFMKVFDSTPLLLYQIQLNKQHTSALVSHVNSLKRSCIKELENHISNGQKIILFLLLLLLTY